jgi:hypothetical protein
VLGIKNAGTLPTSDPTVGVIVYATGAQLWARTASGAERLTGPGLGGQYANAGGTGANLLPMSTGLGPMAMQWSGLGNSGLFPAIELDNPTDATSGAKQNSPAAALYGRSWDGSASKRAGWLVLSEAKTGSSRGDAGLALYHVDGETKLRYLSIERAADLNRVKFVAQSTVFLQLGVGYNEVVLSANTAMYYSMNFNVGGTHEWHTSAGNSLYFGAALTQLSLYIGGRTVPAYLGRDNNEWDGVWSRFYHEKPSPQHVATGVTLAPLSSFFHITGASGSVITNLSPTGLGKNSANTVVGHAQVRMLNKGGPIIFQPAAAGNIGATFILGPSGSMGKLFYDASGAMWYPDINQAG